MPDTAARPDFTPRATILKRPPTLDHPPRAAVQALGAFALKGLPGVESLSQLTVPDLPATFPPLRLEKPAPVDDDRNPKLT